MKKKLPIILAVLGAGLVIFGATQVWAAWQMEHGSNPITVTGYTMIQGIIAMVGGGLGLVLAFAKPKLTFAGGVVALAMVAWVIVNPQVAAKGGDGKSDFSFEKTEDGGVKAIEERSDAGVSDDLLALEKMAEEEERKAAESGNDGSDSGDGEVTEELATDPEMDGEMETDSVPMEVAPVEEPAEEEKADPNSEIGSQDPSKVEAAETNYKPAMGLWMSLAGSVLLLLTALFGGAKSAGKR